MADISQDTARPHSRRSGLRRLAARLAVVAYVVVLARLTLLPLGPVGRRVCEYRPRPWKLDLFSAIRDVTDAFAAQGVGALSDGAVTDVLVNVLLFAPIGFAVTRLWRRSIWIAGATGLGLSVLVEVLQGSAVFGLFECAWRQADISDVVSNTFGALLGAIIGATLRHRSTSATNRPDE